MNTALSIVEISKLTSLCMLMILNLIPNLQRVNSWNHIYIFSYLYLKCQNYMIYNYFSWNLIYLPRLIIILYNYLSRYDLLLKVGQLRSRCTWPFPYRTACTCRMQQYTTWIAFIWCAPSTAPVTISPCMIISPRRSYCWLLVWCCNARFGSSCYSYWTTTRAAATSAISLNATSWLAQI